ncbi:lipolysis-stimulated lipoprotein receptor isoform X2 [Rhinatrema bivittatum]|uniref:lipolysis-stimulated lipoprotein receptor isoform X2 n=1 Tax=Rhinatrema bivittatum TaxID=194408 RepID=UPI00112EAC35|nr:lipolysis-stimulated lipoprotein receptor isoform X2 [Rhinatrema bivittatum]
MGAPGQSASSVLRRPGARSVALLFLCGLLPGLSHGIQVTILNPFNVVILFQPVTLQCNYQTSAQQPPTVIWKYKSYCRNRITDAFSSASQDTQINAQLQQNNPGYNPYVDCQDNVRTVRVVATKLGSAVTLGEFYQGRRITINNNADLSIDQTAWGDSGVYYCTVISSQDLQGNNEAYAELIVLDWLFVVLVILGGFLVFLLIGICWCQCCPHTCCCYVRCPCCPEKCCCPRALYEAGKAATTGVPSIYAPSVYAPSIYSHPNQLKMGVPGAVIPMGPVPPTYNGYGMDYDAASSVGGHSSQVPLIRDDGNSVRSGYRIQANQQDDSMRVLYYMEKELANFDPSRPGASNGKFEKASAMSEISSLHEENQRNNFRKDLGQLRNQALTPIRDLEEESLLSSETRRTRPPRQDRYEEDRYRGGWDREHGRRPRTRSMDDLDDLERPGHNYYEDQNFDGRDRERRNSDDRSGYDYERRRRDHSSESRDEYYGTRRSRSRDDLRDLDRNQHYRADYDDRFLEDVLRRKQRSGSREDLDNTSSSTARSGMRRNQDNDFPPPPPPPPYTETESLSSRGKNDRKLKKNNALSRESLVV